MIYWSNIIIGIILLSISISNPVYTITIKKHYTMSYKRKIGPQVVSAQKRGFTYPDIKKRPYEDKIDLNSMRKKKT